MTQPDDWDQIFNAVHQVPGSTKQQPAKKTVQALQEEAQFARKRYAADVAVSMGAVDTGEDFDPYEAINEQHNNGGQSTADLKRETDSIAAGLAQLQADVKANNNSGKSFVVSMADYGTGMPDVFTVFDDSGSGTLYNDGNTIQMPNVDGRELFSYNVEPLLTDYFETSLLVPNQPGKTLGSYVNRAVFFLGRGDAAFDNYCVARLVGDKLRVGAVIDGVSTIDSPTWFGSGPTGAGSNELTITPGVYMTFAGGTLAGAKVFAFKVNNQVRAVFADADDDSLIGDDYRWTGGGIRNDDDGLSNKSPGVSHFMANDNAPAAVVGSGATLVRLDTSLVGVSSGVNELPTGFWDSTEEVSEDMDGRVDVSDGSVAVPADDWYSVSVQSRCGTSWVDHFRWVIHKGGSPYKQFGPDYMFGSNALGGTILPGIAGATWTGYLYAEDEISIGYSSTGTVSNVLRGVADGSETYWTIRRGRA